MSGFYIPDSGSATSTKAAGKLLPLVYEELRKPHGISAAKNIR
jgi:hypothetical protein